MEKSHGGILEGQEGAQGAPVCSWAREHQGFVGAISQQNRYLSRHGGLPRCLQIFFQAAFALS